MNSSSTPSPQGDPREVAAARLAERRSRVRRIRNRTAAGSAAAFVAIFGGLYGQLSSGNDPALAKTGTSSGSSATSAPATQAQTQTDSSAASDSSSASGQTWSSSTPSSVKTSQS
jgi:hypothetical protein